MWKKMVQSVCKRVEMLREEEKMLATGLNPRKVKTNDCSKS